VRVTENTLIAFVRLSNNSDFAEIRDNFLRKMLENEIDSMISDDDSRSTTIKQGRVRVLQEILDSIDGARENARQRIG